MGLTELSIFSYPGRSRANLSGVGNTEYLEIYAGPALSACLFPGFGTSCHGLASLASLCLLPNNLQKLLARGALFPLWLGHQNLTRSSVPSLWREL